MITYKIILLLFILLITFNKSFADEIVDENLIELDYKKTERYYDAVFTTNSFYVITIYFDYVETPIEHLFCNCNNLRIYQYDYNFKLLDKFEVERFVVDDFPQKFKLIKFNIENDTMVITGCFNDSEAENKIDFNHLFVIKFFQNREVFRYYEIRNESPLDQYYKRIHIYENNKHIYTLFKSENFTINKYNKNGEFLKKYILFDDSISTKFDVIGSITLKNICSINDKIYVFYSRKTKQDYRSDYFYNIYDEELNLLKEEKFLDSTYDQFNNGIKIFNLEDNNIMVFQQRLGSLVSKENFATCLVYSINDSTITKFKNNIGQNYSDWINDIKKYSDGYVAVGKFSNIPSPPYVSPLIQKTDSNFKVYESFIFHGINTNFERIAEKIHVLSEDSYIVISNSTADFIYFQNKFKTNTSEIEMEITTSPFPNPSNNYIKIPNLVNGVNFSIYDIVDKKIISGKYNNNINISTLSPGTYFLEYEIEKSTKFIKFLKI